MAKKSQISMVSGSASGSKKKKEEKISVGGSVKRNTQEGKNGTIGDMVSTHMILPSIEKINTQTNLKPTTGVESGIFSKDINNVNDMGIYIQSSNIYSRKENDWYNKFSRFGMLDPYNGLSNTREYLFFTKPDLHIYEPGTRNLNPELKDNSFFVELDQRYPQVAEQLQQSIYTKKTDNFNIFIPILSNSVKNTLDMPEISAGVIDTPKTIFGSSINYRGDAFNAGENHDFSLEFEDTKYLELYHFFKAMEKYAQLKKVGMVTPPNVSNSPKSKEGYVFTKYHKDKVLHDQFSIFKIITDDDFQDIIYYALFTGVFTKTVPREAFSDLNPENGLRYNVQFQAQFVDDSEPWILSYFDYLVDKYMKLSSKPVWLDVFNTEIGETDGRLAKCPYVVKQYQNKTYSGAWLAPTSMKYKYQLRWRLE